MVKLKGDTKTWHTKGLHDQFGHASIRLGHAKQLRSTYRKIVDSIEDKIGIDSNRHVTFNQTLEDLLEIRDLDFSNKELLEARISQHLPFMGSDEDSCVSFQRAKAPQALQKKIKQGRNTQDTYGMQLWVSPQKIVELEALEKPQDELVKKWTEKGIEFNASNFYSIQKPHGYRAFHADFNCPGNNNWSEGLEIQFMTFNSMMAYLLSRNSYLTYIGLKPEIESEKGKNQNNWDQSDRDLLYPLRDYIKALFEVAAYEDGLMDLTNIGHSTPDYQSVHQARAAVNYLRPIATDIFTGYYNIYDKDAVAMLQYKNDIVRGLKQNYSPEQDASAREADPSI